MKLYPPDKSKVQRGATLTWVLGKHWNLEASLSAGYILFDYTKYQCEHCGKEVAKEKKNYLGPTKATLSLIYTF